jgi:hypothetical protein
MSDAEIFDLTANVCRDRTCVPVYGDILVYRDTNHITKTYALSLAEDFAGVLQPHP